MSHLTKFFYLVTGKPLKTSDAVSLALNQAEADLTRILNKLNCSGGKPKPLHQSMQEHYARMRILKEQRIRNNFEVKRMEDRIQNEYRNY